MRRWWWRFWMHGFWKTNLQKFKKHSRWGGSGGTWSGGAALSSHQMCGLEKRICEHLKKDQCEEVVVALHHHCTASRCTAYQKESANNFKKVNVRRWWWHFWTSGLPSREKRKKQSIITINIMCHGATQGGEVHKVIVCKNVFFQCMKW